MTNENVLNIKILGSIENNGCWNFDIIEVGRSQKSKIRGPTEYFVIFEAMKVFGVKGHADGFERA